jgi:ribose transport system substrate-binding protein
LSIALAAMLVAGGCSVNGNGGGGSGGHYNFELITKSNDSPYWLAVRDGAESAAKKLGVSITFEAPPTETDLQQQLTMFDDAMTKHVDGIVLAAQQPQALTGPVRTAQQQGIPVVTVDSGVQQNVADSFIATSNIQSAGDLARLTAGLAGNKGQYGIIDFNQVADTGRERPQGFQWEMAKIPGFKYVGMQISNNDVATGKQEASAMLQSNPGISLMFGANDRAALGLAEAVQAAHAADRVVVAGFDADAGELPLIRSGVIKASVLQSPRDMGYQAVQEMVAIKQHKPVPKQVSTPYFILTPQNLDTPQAKGFINQYVQ